MPGHNVLCPICLKEERGFGYEPALAGRPGEYVKFCSQAHCDRFMGQNMSHKLEDDEDAPLFEAVKAAGQYLDSLKIYDLRYLSKAQLMMMGSIVISRFAEQRAGWFENKRHPDDKMPGLDFDDEIPF